jgi:hypothetical protein
MVGPLKRVGQFCLCHDKNMTKMYGNGIIFCRVPDKEWSFQDVRLYIVKKVGVKILTIIVLYRLS